MPVSPERLALFVPLMAVMAITPGPANLFAIATGLNRGAATALVGVVGMNAGTLVWFAGAALGLGALVAAYPALFQALAIAGAAYVAWLAGQRLWAAWRGAAGEGPVAAHAQPMGGGAFRAGMAVQLSNPKALIFFTAILPPFLDPAQPIPAQLAVFGAIMILFDAAAIALRLGRFRGRCRRQACVARSMVRPVCCWA